MLQQIQEILTLKTELLAKSYSNLDVIVQAANAYFNRTDGGSEIRIDAKNSVFYTNVDGCVVLMFVPVDGVNATVSVMLNQDVTLAELTILPDKTYEERYTSRLKSTLKQTITDLFATITAELSAPMDENTSEETPEPDTAHTSDGTEVETIPPEEAN